MKVVDHHFVDRQGVALIHSLTVNDLRWLFRVQAVSDVGIDAHLEIVLEGRATGQLLALQIKSGESYFRETVAEGFVYRNDEAHLNYWLNHSLPVVLVICKPGTQEAYSRGWTTSRLPFCGRNGAREVVLALRRIWEAM